MGCGASKKAGELGAQAPQRVPSQHMVPPLQSNAQPAGQQQQAQHPTNVPSDGDASIPISSRQFEGVVAGDSVIHGDSHIVDPSLRPPPLDASALAAVLAEDTHGKPLSRKGSVHGGSRPASSLSVHGDGGGDGGGDEDDALNDSGLMNRDGGDLHHDHHNDTDGQAPLSASMLSTEDEDARRLQEEIAAALNKLSTEAAADHENDALVAAVNANPDDLGAGAIGGSSSGGSSPTAAGSTRPKSVDRFSRPASAAPVDEPGEVEEAAEPEDTFEQTTSSRLLHKNLEQDPNRELAALAGGESDADRAKSAAAAAAARKAASLLEDRMKPVAPTTTTAPSTQVDDMDAMSSDLVNRHAELLAHQQYPHGAAPMDAVEEMLLLESQLNAERVETEAQREFRRRKETEERRLMAQADIDSHRREVEDARRYRSLQEEMDRERDIEERQRIRQLEEEAIAKDLEDLADPNLVSFNVVFMSGQSSSATGDHRRVYRFHLPRDSASLLDLKLAVNMDFGYAFTQQRFYYKYRELDDDTQLPQLPGWSDSSVLIFFPVGLPTAPPERVFRPLQREPAIAELRYANCDPHARPEDDAHLRSALGGKYPNNNANAAGNSATSALPVYRNWMREFQRIRNWLHRGNNTLAVGGGASGRNGGSVPSTSITEALDAERALVQFERDFLQVASSCVDLVCQKRIEPVFVHELLGNGGEKYFCGGLFLRRVGDWEMLGENIGEGDAAFKVAGHELKSGKFVHHHIDEAIERLRTQITQLRAKIAQNHTQNPQVAAEAQHQSQQLETLLGILLQVDVPPTACVDLYGNRFLVSAVPPVDHDTLCYGSSTDGLLVHNSERRAVETANALGALLNIRPHAVREHLSGLKPTLGLPFTVQVHAESLSGESGADARHFPDSEAEYFAASRFSASLGGSASSGADWDPDSAMTQGGFARRLYLLSTCRLFAPDKPSGEKIDVISKLFRPDFAVKFGNPEEIKPGFRFYKTLNPRTCAVTNQIINDYEYYYYDKRDYYVSRNAFENEPERRFLYPKNKLVLRQVPPEERVSYWMHDETREVLPVSEKPIVQRPLNPDAYVDDQDLQDRQQLEFAHLVLEKFTIPEFFAQLVEQHVDPLVGADLTAEFHRHGVNMRYLGRLAEETPHQYLREVCVREMLARTIKTLMRDGLSFMTDYNERDAKAIIVHYLNEIFTHDESKDSVTVWKYIEELTLKKFAYRLDERVRDKVYSVALLQSIAAKLNFTLRAYRGYDFSRRQPFTLDDVVHVRPCTKTIGYESKVVARLWREAKQLDERGKRSVWYLAGGPERQQATDRFREALSAAEHVYGANDSHVASILYDFAEHLESRHCERGRPENSRWNHCALVPEDDLSREAEICYTRALAIFELSHGSSGQQTPDYHVAWCKMGLARLYKIPFSVDDRSSVSGSTSSGNTSLVVAAAVAASANALATRTTASSAAMREAVAKYPPVRWMNEALDILEQMVGFQHPETGDAYQSVALLYQELNDCERASHWIRRAFFVFHAVFGLDGEETRQCHQFLKSIEMRVDDRLEQCPIEDLPRKIELIEFGGEDDTETDRSEM